MIIAGIITSMEMLSVEEKKLFQTLNSPKKIQDFINTLGKKPEIKNGHIVRSPRYVLQTMTANCMEGALLAAAIQLYYREKPLLLDLKVGKNNNKDVDHVVALFEKDGYFGAISKTSHAVLRYREPIYKTLRELVLSYFHEYFTNDDGKKTLRSFSKPFDVQKRFGTRWITTEHDIFEIAVALDESPHFEILTKAMERNLRPADPIEIKAGKLIE
jgi:hypothetical protein